MCGYFSFGKFSNTVGEGAAAPAVEILVRVLTMLGLGLFNYFTAMRQVYNCVCCCFFFCIYCAANEPLESAIKIKTAKKKKKSNKKRRRNVKCEMFFIVFQWKNAWAAPLAIRTFPVDFHMAIK